MSIFATYEDKARKALDDATGRQALAIAELDAHRLAPADPGDFDAIKAWGERESMLAQDVNIAVGVVEHWRGIVAKHEAEAAEKAADAEHAAAERQAKADEKLVREIIALSEKLAAKRDELKASIASTEVANAKRGTRPYIQDAEKRVRMIRGKTIPAEYRDETVWEDGAGNRPAIFGPNDDGELVPREMGYTKKTRRVLARAEQVTPDLMPTRLADAITLVNLAGRSL